MGYRGGGAHKPAQPHRPSRLIDPHRAKRGAASCQRNNRPRHDGAVSLRVGCAMWANKDWIGRALPASTPLAGLLRAYQQLFGAVEGNTTFYGLPRESTVARWAAETGPSFRFLFKLPRSISHDRRLRDASADVAGFCRRLSPLGDRLGPTSLQLPPSFGPEHLAVLEQFLVQLPKDWPWAVEVRHHDFFAGGSSEQALDALLARCRVDRVILDSRALFSRPPANEVEAAAHAAKPRLPVRPTATSTRPVVRFIGHVDTAISAEHWGRWFPIVLRWLEQGLEPTLLFHTADNLNAPLQAQRFQAELAGLGSHLITPAPPPVPGAQ